MFADQIYERRIQPPHGIVEKPGAFPYLQNQRRIQHILTRSSKVNDAGSPFIPGLHCGNQLPDKRDRRVSVIPCLALHLFHIGMVMKTLDNILPGGYRVAHAHPLVQSQRQGALPERVHAVGPERVAMPETIARQRFAQVDTDRGAFHRTRS